MDKLIRNLSATKIESTSYTSSRNNKDSVDLLKSWIGNVSLVNKSPSSLSVDADASFLEPYLNPYSSTRKKVDYADVQLKISNNVRLLVSIVNEDEFIEGNISKTQLFLEGLYKDDKQVFRDTFEKTWLAIYIKKDSLIYNFISNVASIEYSWLQEKADSLIIAGFAHKNPSVNEAVIRAVEYWEQPKHLEYLNKMREFEISWLEEYKQNVMKYLRSIE